jgi:HEAT repeat protein
MNVAAGTAACLILLAWCARAEALQDLSKWKLGDDKTPAAFEERLRNTPLDKRGPIEDELIKVVGSSSSTPESRRFACRILQRIGTKKCVPVLGGLLVDKELSHYARLALERMKDCPEAGQALQDALGKASDPLKVGIIASLGRRCEKGAIPALKGLTGSSDAKVASTAFLALGKMRCETSLGILKGAKASGPVESARLDALLTCVEAFDGKQAAEVYDTIYTSVKTEAHRAGALVGLVRTDEKKATAIILDLMGGKDSYLRDVAIGCIANVKSVELTKAVAATLKDLTPEGRASTIGVLGARGDSAAVDSIAACLGDSNGDVREAAIMAVAALGNGSHVPLLLKCVNNDATRDKALAGLSMMDAKDIDDAIIAKLNDKELSAAAIKAVAKRKCAKAVPELLKLAKTGTGSVQTEAWNALGATASAPYMDALMTAMLDIKDEKLKTVAADAVKYICGHAADKQQCFEVVAKHYGKADEAAKELILELASVAGGEKALELVRSALKSGNKKLYDRAVRSLCSWVDTQATRDLMEVARSAPDEKTRIVALRGFMTVAEREGNERNRAKSYSEIRGLIKRADEKRLLISKLRGTRDVASVKMLSDYVSDAEVSKEASMAAIDLTKAMTKRGPKNELKALMDKVLATCKDKGVQKRAADARKKLGK